MDKYNEKDNYCYANTCILINKFDITDEKELEELEQAITSRANEIIKYNKPPYDMEYLQKIHKILFGKMYEWAENIRDVSISKGDTLFCMPQYISSSINKIFKDLENDDWLKNLYEDSFYDKMSYYYCEFNMIHPFREGNGRVQRILFQHLALYNRYSFNWLEVKQDDWLEVNIQGVADYFRMKEMFKNILIKK